MLGRCMCRLRRAALPPALCFPPGDCDSWGSITFDELGVRGNPKNSVSSSTISVGSSCPYIGGVLCQTTAFLAAGLTPCPSPPTWLVLGLCCLSWGVDLLEDRLSGGVMGKLAVVGVGVPTGVSAGLLSQVLLPGPRV